MYNYEWSLNKVAEFWQQHTKSCAEIELLYKIDLKASASFLAGDGHRWHNYKKMVKNYEKNVETWRFYFDATPEVRAKYKTFARWCIIMLDRINYPNSMEGVDTQLELF